MRRLAYILLLSVMFILESTITTVPLVLVTLILLYVIKKDTALFPLAFVYGFILDIALVRTIGYSSLFFTLILFIIFSYERKFEVQTASFIFFATLIGSALYIFLFSDATKVILYALTTATIVALFFATLRRVIE